MTLQKGLAVIGFAFISLLMLGALGVGNARFYYGHDEKGCTKLEAKK